MIHMFSNKRNIVCIIVLLFGCALCTAAPSTDLEKKKDRVDELFSQWDKPDSPGAAVVIVQNSKIIYKKNYGMADLEHNIPINEFTVFCVGSVSKQFTGFAIAQLEEEGKLSLDDDIRKYIPELPDFGKTIQIRHLIHHTSGLREQFHLLTMAGVSLADTITMEQILKLVKRQKKLNFKPGDQVMYSNTGYSLLAEIVQRITGKSFREYMEETIFKPLGMTNSHFHDESHEIIKNKANPYMLAENDVLMRALLNHEIVGNTGLFTSAGDLAKWIMNFMQPKIGGPNLLIKMTRTFVLNNGEKSDYGFGIGVTQHWGLRVLLHSGHDSGYRCYLSYFPEQTFGIAVLTNFYSLNPSAVGRKIEKIFLAELLPPTETEKPKRESTPGRTTPNSQPVFSLTEQQLKEYTGKFYSEELDTTYHVIIRNGKLFLTHIRNDDVLLTPAGKDIFSGSAWWLKSVFFTRDKSGRISGYKFSSSRAQLVYFRLR